MTVETSPLPATDSHALDELLDAAAAAAPVWAATPASMRADALDAAADALDAAADHLVPLADAETHLGAVRLTGELKRTTFQLRLFGELLRDGGYLRVAIDHADPDWPPAPRPDLRLTRVPLGPVVVFAASNFPFAFSTAGGDTASALAAGCPVLLKAHPGHLALTQATAAVLDEALIGAGAPAGIFAVIAGDEAGRAAVTDPRVNAGAFTGSIAGGRALFDLATSRSTPIPFFGELGSVNPVVVTAAALAARRSEILEGYVGSFTLGAGQFCTKPGLLFAPESVPVAEELTALVAEKGEARLLNQRISAGFAAAVSGVGEDAAVSVLHQGAHSADVAAPTLLATTAERLLDRPEVLAQECFGPASMIVTYTDDAQLLAALSVLEGQLTATIQAAGDEPRLAELIALLATKVGRVIFNDWPTGVAVSWAMQHGGPYPATTAPSTTSVGTSAIDRFLRPVAFQSIPDALLPPALQEANPLSLPRLVDGRRV